MLVPAYVCHYFFNLTQFEALDVTLVNVRKRIFTQGQCYDTPTYRQYLTHWGRVTHICVSKQTITVSDKGLSPGRRQAIIWTNAGLLLIGPLGTKFNEILIEIHTFSFKEMHLKMSSGKWRPFCLGLNVLTLVALNLFTKHKQLGSCFVENQDLFILHNLYHGCWCLGDIKELGHQQP